MLMIQRDVFKWSSTTDIHQRAKYVTEQPCCKYGLRRRRRIFCLYKFLYVFVSLSKHEQNFTMFFPHGAQVYVVDVDKASVACVCAFPSSQLRV